ncbi:lysM domain receptor-like kinase 3 [Ziziphus jujuba]|uniref:LysM domain receptor-like kinase 3 n=1 Tax=Ziziphus jujuba TaxID=326968 RepID=A0A6P6G809_ZIZJJ|nr:lysM domain receptor-like kinase 3 [Ziziphus jujuba]
MAFLNYQYLFLILFITICINVVIKSTSMQPFSCSDEVQTCKSYLYHISKGLQIDQIASFYSVNASEIKPIIHGTKQDYLVSVTCTCKNINGVQGYFYDTFYKVQSGDLYSHVVQQFYSGQAWDIEGEDEPFVAGNITIMHLLCGCVEKQSQRVVTYTAQEHDTLSQIAELLSASLSETQELNGGLLTQNPSFIDVGWVLFVPMEMKGIKAPKQGKRQNLATIIGISSAAALLLMAAFLVFLLRRYKYYKNREEDPKAFAKPSSPQNQKFNKDIEGVTTFETERPVVYSIEEINEATGNFDEIRKIGEGGYGSVYFGILGKREVAIKKMKSSRTKEFFSELKVLCKIHHINVVELLGYASGEDHLYLVYEYIHNGSLNDHLHDPLLKGHQPLSWTARAHIALDAARGIEYIHDHTKTRYVHRDIKTSNILLDQGLRAKVADFGLARLVERSNEEEVIATCVVGTLGYIPPESVRELQMTSKTDVFAFGVVLAELITGLRAVIRDNREPNKMKSLISVIFGIFDQKNPETALEAIVDGNLRGSCPVEEVYKMAYLARQCLSEDPINRPEMKEIVQTLSQILISSMEWEASLGGKSQVFSALLNGR